MSASAAADTYVADNLRNAADGDAYYDILLGRVRDNWTVFGMTTKFKDVPDDAKRRGYIAAVASAKAWTRDRDWTIAKDIARIDKIADMRERNAYIARMAVWWRSQARIPKPPVDDDPRLDGRDRIDFAVAMSKMLASAAAAYYYDRVPIKYGIRCARTIVRLVDQEGVLCDSSGEPLTVALIDGSKITLREFVLHKGEEYTTA